MCVNLYITPPPDWTVDMQVYAVVSAWFSPRQASDGVIVCVKFCCPLLYLTDSSEIRQTSRLPLPTSTVTQPNGATSSSGDVEYCL